VLLLVLFCLIHSGVWAFVVGRTAGVLDNLETMACDCLYVAGDLPRQCYTSVQIRQLGVFHACSTTVATFEALPAILETYQDTDFVQGCVDIQVPHQRQTRPHRSEYTADGVAMSCVARGAGSKHGGVAVQARVDNALHLAVPVCAQARPVRGGQSRR
jgi:hypothetical protein